MYLLGGLLQRELLLYETELKNYQFFLQDYIIFLLMAKTLFFSIPTQNKAVYF